MTCAESELLMAGGETSAGLEDHLAGCAACQGLWSELAANRDALRAMGSEALPAVPISIRPAYPWWKWSSAAAAVLIMLGATWWATRPPKAPQITSVNVTVTGIVQPPAPAVAKAPVPMVPVANREPLKIKMLTADPDVVIYWLID